MRKVSYLSLFKSLLLQGFLYVSVILLFNLLIILPTGEAASGGNLPFVIITVDAETKGYDRDVSLPLPEQVNAVCLDEQPCGLQLMVRLLQEKGYPAIFFLSVYEYKKYGERAILNIAKWLDESGQDVQLHTHPPWAYDKNRKMMYQYSLEGQSTIIKEGKELLQKWTGNPVVAHRAGSYGADKNTLDALIANGILYDTSLFFDHSNSKINSLGLKKNVLSMYGPLYEFPVTVYKKNEFPPLLENMFEGISRIRKYDVNWFADEVEAEKVLEKAINLRMDFVILFLHSFSFIKEYNRRGEKTADMEAINKFNGILDFLSAKGFKVITFKEISNNDIDLNQHLNRPDVIPEISIKIGIFDYLRKTIGINRHNYKLFIVSFSISFVLLALLIVSCLRKGRKRPDSNQTH
jgi:peptidoglycan/xylan/chitin deacetylase (PgdA/CDA1 family)